MRSLIALCAWFAAAALAHAADVTVRVTDATGAPVRHAVVSFAPDGGHRGPIAFDWPHQIAQRNLAFEPAILIAPVGAEVRFPNLDRVRHHVYSFSEGNRFELTLYGRDETRAHRFRTAGIAAIGCNIHDQMRAYIIITDTPFIAITGADGVARLTGAAGAGQLRVWHADLRARGGILSRPARYPAAGAVQEALRVDLRAAHAGH
jgi:plastocyanin